MPILHCGLVLGSGDQKKLPEENVKKLPLRKRATKTPRRSANSTGKWWRPNKGGGALAPAFKSRTAPCAPPAMPARSEMALAKRHHHHRACPSHCPAAPALWCQLAGVLELKLGWGVGGVEANHNAAQRQCRLVPL